MESTSTIVKVIGGLAITLLVVTFGFFIYKSMKASGNKMVEQSVKINQSAVESQYTEYDGETISGEQVIDLIKSMESEGKVGVKVMGQQFVTDGNGTPHAVKTTSAGDVTPDLTGIAAADKSLWANAKNAASSNYINPANLYTGSVVRSTANNAIVNIVFE